MRNSERMWRAAAGYLPLILTVAASAPLAGVSHLGAGLVVLGAAVSLTARHRRPSRLSWAVRIPAAALATGLLGALFAVSLPLGDVVYAGAVIAAEGAGRFGPRYAAAGRSLLLPLTALFLAPPLPPGRHPAQTLGWALLACLIAATTAIAVPALLPRPRPSTREVARAARAAVAAGGRSAISRLDGAALALDARVAADHAARRALCALQHTVDRVRSGAAPPSSVQPALDALDAAVRRTRADGASRSGTGTGAGDPADRPSPSVFTRRAAQAGTAVALAFLAGQLLMPEHWPWTVITVVTVAFGARSRGEVLVKSGQRLAGAGAATAVATPLAAALAGHRGLTVAAILAVLAAGMYLREFGYAWWAAAITGVLALLFGLSGQAGGAGLLGERLLAIALGGACAILPATLLAPIRTRDLVRKRVATCLRRIRDCLAAARDQGAPDIAAVRRVDAALADLHEAARPLRLLRGRPEHAWVDALDAYPPRLRSLALDPRAGTTADLRRGLGALADQLRPVPATT